MKYLLFVFVLVVMTFSGIWAQPKVTLSQSFPEPDYAWNQVLQLKGGNTILLQYRKKAGLEASVYDKQRRLISKSQIKSSQWSDRQFSEIMFDGFHEIGSQPVLFLSQVINRIPTLFRITLDAETGNLMSEEPISTIPEYKPGMWEIANPNYMNGIFHIEKDPRSDYYAVMTLNYDPIDADHRMEIAHYSGEGGMHKEFNRRFCNASKGKFKHLYFLGITVIQKDVYVCSYGYPAKWNAAESRLIMSKLSAGQSEFIHKELEHEADFRSHATMLYNPGTNMIQLLTLAKQSVKSSMLSAKSTTYYALLMNYFDPETLGLVTSRSLTAQKVSEALRAQTKKEDYSGMPVDMILNKDNSTTVLYEEMATTEVRDANGRVRRATTALGSAGISELNDRGIETEGHAVLKLHNAIGYIDPLFHVQKGAGRWGAIRTAFGNTSNAFYSYKYVNTGKSKYVLFNDYPKNFEKAAGQNKRQPVGYATVTNMVCYKLTEGGLPEKSYVFGAPQNKGDTRFGFIQYAHFLPEQNTYATVVIMHNGREKEAALAWISFD